LSVALTLDTVKRRALLGASAENFLWPASGTLLACVAFWRLKGATENGNLHSETYKSLNLGLTIYSAFMLAAYLISFPFLGASGAAVHLYSIVVGFYGWVVGCQGVNYVAGEGQGGGGGGVEWGLLSQSFVNMLR